MRKTTIALILCILLCLPAFASCGGSGETPATTAATAPAATEPADAGADTADVTTAATTVDKWEEIVPKITMIAERDRTLRIEYSTGGSEEKWSRNDIYLEGPDEVVDGVTPLIQQMIYERNEAAKNCSTSRSSTCSGITVSENSSRRSRRSFKGEPRTRRISSSIC